MVEIYIEIRGPLDSKKLFEEIEPFGGVNVTDLGDKVLVYGVLPFMSAVTALSFCSEYGEILASSIHKKD